MNDKAKFILGVMVLIVISMILGALFGVNTFGYIVFSVVAVVLGFVFKSMVTSTVTSVLKKLPKKG